MKKKKKKKKKMKKKNEKWKMISYDFIYYLNYGLYLLLLNIMTCIWTKLKRIRMFTNNKIPLKKKIIIIIYTYIYIYIIE